MDNELGCISNSKIIKLECIGCQKQIGEGLKLLEPVWCHACLVDVCRRPDK